MKLRQLISNFLRKFKCNFCNVTRAKFSATNRTNLLKGSTGDPNGPVNLVTTLSSTAVATYFNYSTYVSLHNRNNFRRVE